MNNKYNNIYNMNGGKDSSNTNSTDSSEYNTSESDYDDSTTTTTSDNDVINDQNIIVANDQIHIPKYFPYIEVIGAVNFPGRYPYSTGKTTSDFIKMAGGIIRNKSGKKFLVKSTTSQRIKLNNRQKLSSGDIIFIAEKLEYNQWLAAKEIVTAIGQLATIVLVIQRILETN